jgi:hypothetical protein
MTSPVVGGLHYPFHTPMHVDSAFANCINAAKLFQLFIKNRIVPYNGKMSSAYYDRIRITKDMIPVDKSFEFCDF